MPELDQEPEGDLSEIFERLKRLLTRRRWWIILPASVISLGVIAVLHFLPNHYSSEATIIVVQQQVPERYVTPNSTSDIMRVLDAMKQEVLSRTRLLAIIEDLNLYPKERKRLSPEGLVDLMRTDVGITPVFSRTDRPDITAFTISFIANTPRLAQETTSRLTTLFIRQNLKAREDQAVTTTKFLNTELDAAKQKLAIQEQRLRDFKMQYLGQLPEQQQGNLSILTGLQAQLQNAVNSRNRAQQQQLYLESLLVEYRRIPARDFPAAVSISPEQGTLKPAPVDPAAESFVSPMWRSRIYSI